MAGRLTSTGTYRFLLVVLTLSLVGTILTATGLWNPVPQIEAWWYQLTKLSEPEPAWNVRLDSRPTAGAVYSNAVVAADGEKVSGYRRTDGALMWTYPAYWAIPAGDSIIIRSKPTNRNERVNRGYTVIDPATGGARWSDQESIAVWGYSDQVVELTCPENADCVLRGRELFGKGDQLWRATLPAAAARRLEGASPGAVGLVDPAEWFSVAAAGVPKPLPPVFALRMGDTIQILDVRRSNPVVREVVSVDPQVRATFAGQRILFSKSERTPSGCSYSIEGRTFDTDQRRWAASELDLGTGSGTTCAQRGDAIGAGGRILALAADDSPVVINATDGAQPWVGVPGEQILATDGEIAVVLGADRKTVRVIDLGNPGGRPSFTGTFGLEPKAAVTDRHVVIQDTDLSELVVLGHFAGADGTLPVLKRIKTRATVMAIGAYGVLINNGRRVGYIPLF